MPRTGGIKAAGGGGKQLLVEEHGGLVICGSAPNAVWLPDVAQPQRRPILR